MPLLLGHPQPNIGGTRDNRRIGIVGIETGEFIRSCWRHKSDISCRPVIGKPNRLVMCNFCHQPGLGLAAGQFKGRQITPDKRQSGIDNRPVTGAAA